MAITSSKFDPINKALELRRQQEADLHNIGMMATTGAANMTVSIGEFLNSNLAAQQQVLAAKAQVAAQRSPTSSEIRAQLKRKATQLTQAYELTEHPTAIIRAVKQGKNSDWYYQVRLFASPAMMEDGKVSNSWFTYASLADVHPPGLQALFLGLTETYSPYATAVFDKGAAFAPSGYKPDGCEEATAYFEDDVEPTVYVNLVVNGPQWEPVLTAKRKGA